MPYPPIKFDPSVRPALALVVLLVAVASWPGAPAASASQGPQDDDVDAFMEKVLERRVSNREALYRHTVRDRESLNVNGPGGQAIESFQGEYIWYVREGYLVRSPWEVNGVRVGDDDREEAERRWLDRAREREERQREREREAEESGEALERDYFLGFPFEPGNYFVAGREERNGHDVLRIEYYPEKLFEDDDEGAEPDAEDEEWTRRFQKTTLVTLWVLPEEHQILEISFENVGLEFLPMRWLVQIDDVEASMTMHRPFPDQDVWLPSAIRAHGSATMATGSYGIEYSLDYFDYREAEVAAKVQFRLPREQRN